MNVAASERAVFVADIVAVQVSLMDGIMPSTATTAAVFTTGGAT